MDTLCRSLGRTRQLALEHLVDQMQVVMRAQCQVEKQAFLIA